jgi:hypothetical protein
MDVDPKDKFMAHSSVGPAPAAVPPLAAAD